MNLIASTWALQIILGEAKTTNDCDITSSYADYSGSNFTLGATNISSNGTTSVVVVPAPAVDSKRQVKEVRLFNNDTIPHNVTLRLFDGTRTWIVGTNPLSLPVPVGGSFVYTPEAGESVADAGVTAVVAGTNLNVGAGPGGAITTTGTLNVVDIPALGGIVGNAATLTVHGLAAGTGGQISMAGGTSSTAAAAGGAMNINGGLPGVGGNGGAVTIAGAAGNGAGNGGGVTIDMGAGGGGGGVAGVLALAHAINLPGAAAGTLTNAPIAGNPQTWLQLSINGVVHWVPAWHL